MAFYKMRETGSIFRPSSILALTFLAFVLLTFLATFAAANPVPDSEDVDNFAKDSVKKLKENEAFTVTGDDGKEYTFTTWDIIWMSLGALLIVFILFCCIGYCLCECVKSLICCIFCCE